MLSTLKPIYQALKRSFWQCLVILLIGVVCIQVAERVPQALGELFAPLVRGFGLVAVGVAVAKAVLNVLDPYSSTKQLVEEALRDKNLASGLVYIGRSVLMCVVIVVMCSASRAATLEAPPQAVALFPTLKAEQQAYWSELKNPSYLAAQIEQETCASLKNSKCWNYLAELKTSREHGVGLGQLTIAYSAAGTVRFDALTELVQHHPKDLKGFSWSNWKDPRLQVRGVILKDRDTCNRITNTKTQADLVAMCMSAYNGGFTGLSNDRLSCRAKAGCDAGVWFGNVELTSIKAKTVIPGYGGQSPFSINRTYVQNVMNVRRGRYVHLDV